MRLYYGIMSADGGAWGRRALAGERPAPQIRSLLLASGLSSLPRRGLAGVLARTGQARLAATLGSTGARSAAAYQTLVAERRAYSGRFLAALDAGRYDAILCPPDALPALRHGTGATLASAGSYSMLFNLLGLPAGVVAATRVRPGEESDRPARLDAIDRQARAAERDSAGLPVGVQVAARRWREDVALAVMAALEAHFSRQPEYPLARQTQAPGATG
jgi:fatty acid amide hydrolase